MDATFSLPTAFCASAGDADASAIALNAMNPDPMRDMRVPLMSDTPTEVGRALPSSRACSGKLARSTRRQAVEWCFRWEAEFRLQEAPGKVRYAGSDLRHLCERGRTA